MFTRSVKSATKVHLRKWWAFRSRSKTWVHNVLSVPIYGRKDTVLDTNFWCENLRHEGCIVRQTAVGHLTRYVYSPSISEDIFYPVRETCLCSNLRFRNLLEKKTERINFRKDFRGCYWRQGKQIAQSPSDFLSGDISLVPRVFLLPQTKTEQSPV